MSCKKIRMNEQWHCHRCGTQWDVDDSDPPVCQHDRLKLRGNDALLKLKHELQNEPAK